MWTREMWQRSQQGSLRVHVTQNLADKHTMLLRVAAVAAAPETERGILV